MNDRRKDDFNSIEYWWWWDRTIKKGNRKMDNKGKGKKWKNKNENRKISGKLKMKIEKTEK